MAKTTKKDDSRFSLGERIFSSQTKKKKSKGLFDFDL